MPGMLMQLYPGQQDKEEDKVMSDGILGIFGSILSAQENLRKRRDALREAFGTKMFGEERWKAYKTFRERRKKPPERWWGQDNYPRGTLSSGSWDQG